METRDVLFSRRSIRKFESRPVQLEDLQAIVEAGITAPSAVNSQSWYIVGVHSLEKMEELRQCLTVPASRLRPELERNFFGYPEVIEDTYQVFSRLGNAPACLMVFAKKAGIPGTDTLFSVAAAIENMLLAAWDKGIGSCWMTGPVNFGLNEFVHEKFAPGKGPLLAIIPLGYPLGSSATPHRKPDRYCII